MNMVFEVMFSGLEGYMTLIRLGKCQDFQIKACLKEIYLKAYPFGRGIFGNHLP